MMKFKNAFTFLVATQVAMGFTGKCFAQAQQENKQTENQQEISNQQSEKPVKEKKIRRGVRLDFGKGAFLGVNLGECENGAKIVGVEGDKPAFVAGIQPNDIITKFNGQEVKSSEDLRKYISAAKPNDKVKLQIQREGNTIEKEVTLGEKKNMFASKMMPNGDIDEFMQNFDFGNLDFKNFDFKNFMPPNKSIPNGDMEIFKPKPALGVQLQDLTPSLAKYFGTTENAGALINEVIKGSAAEKAGLESGDVITSIDGNKVSTLADVRKMISEKKDGQKITIGYLREKSTKTAEITLDSKPMMNGCDKPNMRVFKFRNQNFEQNSEQNKDIDEDIDIDLMMGGMFNKADSSATFELKDGEGLDLSKNKIFSDSATFELKNLIPELNKLQQQFKGLKGFDIEKEIPAEDLKNLDEVLNNTEVKVWHGTDSNKKAVAISIRSKRDKKSKVKNNSEQGKENKNQPTPGANSNLD